MAKVFAQFDTNEDGSLDAAELRKLLITIGLGEDDVVNALPQFDMNKDGQRLIHHHTRLSSSHWLLAKCFGHAHLSTLISACAQVPFS